MRKRLILRGGEGGTRTPDPAIMRHGWTADFAAVLL